MESQLVIKVVLSLAVVVVALGIAWPGRGVRRMAIRRLGVLLVVCAAVAAIISPELSDRVANAIGIGRGADLLLYGLAVSFGLYAISDRRERAHVHRQILQIARAEAIARAPKPSATQPRRTARP